MKKTESDRQNNQKNSNLLPESSIARAFLIFFSHAWDFIESAIEPLCWRTERDYCPEPRTFWKYYLDVDTYIGVRFGDFTRYGMADVDRNSPYHPQNDEKAFKLLLGAFEDIGLSDYVLVQSSYSEGIHIYFFFPEELNTFDVACALRKAVTQAGFKVAPGILELFPNTKPYGKKKIVLYNAHRLPLQHGSFLLDDSFAPYSESVKELIRLANLTAKKHDMELFKEILSTSRQWWTEYKKNRHKNGRESNSIARWRKDVEDLIKEGWTDFGQTNEMLKEIGKFGRVFHGLSGEQLWRFMVETAINCPGYQKYCRHQHEIWSKCRNWAKIIEPYWLPLFSYPERRETYAEIMDRGKTIAGSITNAMRHEDAQERIKKAVAHIRETVGELPTRVKECIKLIKQTTKELFNIVVNETTLRRIENLIYWHPQYRNTEEVQKHDTSPSPEGHNTKIQQPEPIPEAAQALGPRPPNVVCESEVKPKQPEASDHGEHSHRPRTSSLMKGMCGEPPALDQPVPVEEAEETPVETQIEPSTSGSSEQLETYSLINLFETLKRAAVVFFTRPDGQSVFNTVRLKNFPRPQLRGIESNSEVQLLCNNDPDYLHSQHPKLIYIKPTVGADDWLGGIAVPIHFLHPLSPKPDHPT